MRKAFKFILAGAVVFFAFASCESSDDNGKRDSYDEEESYYAGIATISSSDSRFTKTDEGGAIVMLRDGGTVVVNVDCGCEWTAAATTAEGWFELDASSSTLTISVNPNDTDAERSTRIVLSTAGKGISFASIRLTLEAAAYINPGIETVYFDGDEGVKDITVSSNIDWDYSPDDSDSWCSITRNEDVLTVTVTKNPSADDRESGFTISATDESLGFEDVHVGIYQYGNNVDALILAYNIPVAGRRITLPLSGEVDCTVVWGDGSSESVTSPLPTHTYSAVGDYRVMIEGTVTALNSESFSTSDTPVTALTDIVQWGRTGLTNMDYSFCYYTNLTSLPDDTEGSFSEVTSFENAFRHCSIDTLSSGLFRYATKVENFTGLFSYCLFDEVPEDLFANCTSVTSYSYVLYCCWNLTTVPAGLFANSPLVTDFSYAFNYNYNMTEIPADLFANCPEARSFERTFYGLAIKEIPAGLFDHNTKAESFYLTFTECELLETIPKGLFDNCPEVTTFYGVFWTCAIKEIPEGLFKNNTKVTNFHGAFNDCIYLETVPEDLFANCPLVTNFGFLFDLCKSLTTVPAGLFRNNHAVTTIECMYQACYAFDTIPAGLFDAFENLKDASFAFSQCSLIQEIPDGLFKNCSNVTDFSNVFQSCGGVTSVPTDLFDSCTKVTAFEGAFRYFREWVGESPYTEIDGEHVHLYDRERYPSYFSMPTATNNCFAKCELLTDWNSIPSSWGGPTSDANMVEFMEETVSPYDSVVKLSRRTVEDVFLTR